MEVNRTALKQKNLASSSVWWPREEVPGLHDKYTIKIDTCYLYVTISVTPSDT